MAGLEVPLPCGAGGVKRVAGDGLERRKAPKYDLLPFGDSPGVPWGERVVAALRCGSGSRSYVPRRSRQV